MNSEIEFEDYITTVNLESKANQLILASQEMGSFYCVYARIEHLADQKFDIFFECITYKGNIKISIQKATLVKDEEDIYHHIKIYTGVGFENKIVSIDRVKDKGTEISEQDKFEGITLTEKNTLIFERISACKDSLPKYLISEEEFKSKGARAAGGGPHKTPYNLERKQAQSHIAALKLKLRGIMAAASGKFCVVGVSKIVNVK